MIFLEDFFGLYPANPSQAFWRAIEAEALAGEDFKGPLLDLGCGDGKFASVLFGYLGINPAAGCDLSPEKAARARELGLYGEVSAADILKLPYGDASFATVFSNCVIEHIPDELAALKEVARVLRPGGSFIFTVPSTRFLPNIPAYSRLMGSGRTAEALKYAALLDKRLEHYHYHSPDEWSEQLRRAGLKMIKATDYLCSDCEKIWIWFFRAEERAGKLPGPFAQIYNLVLMALARAVMREKTARGDAAGNGGGTVVVARREV